MAIDHPVVVYSDDEKNKAVECNRKNMDALADRWAEKRKGKSLKGKKISLGEYLNNKTND